MVPRISEGSEKKLIGLRMNMNLTENKTGLLWKSFMQRRNEIINRLSNDMVSMQIYPAEYFNAFNPATTFEKWAAVEVSSFENIPAGMEQFILPAGLYAVFHYKGLNTDTGMFQYIFTEWLPNSEFELDQRPHFEILGEKYRNNDPDSEEDIWIPVKKKPF